MKQLQSTHLYYIGAIAYRFSAVYIKFIGTHQQYDAVNAETVELE